MVHHVQIKMQYQLLFVSLYILMGSTFIASAAQMTFTPDADTFITEVTPTLNFGNSDQLVVGLDSQRLEWRSLLRFDIGDLTNVTVNWVRLRFYSKRLYIVTQNVNILPLSLPILPLFPLQITTRNNFPEVP